VFNKAGIPDYHLTSSPPPAPDLNRETSTATIA
jgi:hypothetical protein